jgi:hypothetical protein
MIPEIALMMTLSASDMFGQMLKLEGEWRGSYEWTDGRTGAGAMRVRYTVTGAGSALVEDLINEEGVATMTTVYHLDGDDLRMTHYCAARNQPRLKSSLISDAPSAAEFQFVDVTGMTKYGSVQAFRIEIVDADHLNLRFTFAGNPRTRGVEHIRLTRVTT